jgi:hypothetical protein
MPKVKNQNHHSKFAGTETGYRKIVRNFAMTMIVMVFVLGGALYVYKKINKPEKVSQTQTNVSEIPGWWYQKYFGKSVCDINECKPEADPDSDKLSNAQEYFYHSDPLNFRTAGDELSDGELVAAGFDPSRPGKTAFEEVLSEENIIGESLLFDQDIKKIIAESADISKVNLQLIEDAELKITDDVSEAVYLKYFADLRSTVKKYFSSEDTKIIENGGSTYIVNKSKLLSAELKTISVPARLATFHKYNIAFYDLLSKVIIEPKENNSDVWYDHAQAFLAVQQKLSLETQLLNMEFSQ